MLTRRELLHTAAILGSSSALGGTLPSVIQRALAIDPDPNTTFLDAEHVVILMQENRSFDHAFGSLRGVRGYRDPRPHVQPNGRPVWFQEESNGDIVPPFRLDLEGSNVTWIGGTPHSWPDQVDARNGGKYNRWLQAKRRGDKFPMTMGFYTREDIPFYYELADSFTICDQAFCSSFTGTTPNRLFLWTGTIRKDADDVARVQNGDTDYDAEASWTTFPERLEEANVTWKVYQNEISLDSGFEGEEDAWLSNFTDNPLEWFTQYGVRFRQTRRAFIERLRKEMPDQIAALKAKIEDETNAEAKDKATKDLASLTARLQEVEGEATAYNDAAWQTLSARNQALHMKGLATNDNDPNYRSLTEHSYQDGEEERKIYVPKGDVLHQFRKDVESGQLPAVSWLVAPEHYSDHPGSAWFGAWYLSEAIHILTQDPEVWKKTVFILCYDENDGYFDHVPPFIAPHPNRPETGKVSPGIDTKADVSDAHGRDHSIGLGYRCPLVIASPWTRGGAVNSQVCDHTSIIMFVETWLARKGIHVKETNISDWRRTVCGDLSSAFKPYKGEKIDLPKFLEKDTYIERIHKASFKQSPTPAGLLKAEDVEKFSVAAFQERGTRVSCPLPYDFEASIAPGNGQATVSMAARSKLAGGPFNVYSYGKDFVARAYAVKAGDILEDVIPTSEPCHVRVDGPNGFMREVKADAQPSFLATCRRVGSDIVVTIKNPSAKQIQIALKDAYAAASTMIGVGAGASKEAKFSTAPGKSWYDISVSEGKTEFRFAGRVETGKWTVSDPAMA